MSAWHLNSLGEVLYLLADLGRFGGTILREAWVKAFGMFGELLEGSSRAFRRSVLEAVKTCLEGKRYNKSACAKNRLKLIKTTTIQVALRRATGLPEHVCNIGGNPDPCIGSTAGDLW